MTLRVARGSPRHNPQRRNAYGLPSHPSFQLFGQIEDCWADYGIVGVGDRAEDEIRLVGKGIALALLWPHVVNLAEVVVAKEEARRHLDPIPALILVSLQVGGDKTFV